MPPLKIEVKIKRNGSKEVSFAEDIPAGLVVEGIMSLHTDVLPESIKSKMVAIVEVVRYYTEEDDSK